jgi:hypothetical protein
MKDSEAPQGPHRSSNKTDLAPGRSSNGHRPDPSSNPGGPQPPTSDWPGFETWVEMRHRLIDVEADEARVRRLKAAASVAEAKAKEAMHHARAEPKRQRMTLLERTTALGLEILKYALAGSLTLAIIGLQIVGFLINPWLLSLNLLIGCLGLWARRFATRGKEEQGPPHSEGDP